LSILVTLLSIQCVTTILYADDLPDIPDMIRVTVDHSDNGVLIQWEPSEDKDIEFYHLYKMNDDLAFEKVFSFSANTLEYKHMTSGLKNLAYAVTAEDSAGNESLFEQNVHRAVAVSVSFDPCTPANQITWTPYVGWEKKVSGYKIFGGPVGGTMQMLSIVDSATTSFTHLGIVPNTTYSYYIETVNLNGITSLSAIEEVESVYPDPPGFMAIDYVSVVGETDVELQFSVDLSSTINDFRVMKRSNPGTPFIEVGTILDANQSTMTIMDEFPASTISYEYQVQSVYQPANCNTPIVLSVSNPGTNILVDYDLSNQVVTLDWTPYLSYVTGLSGYTIQRRTGSGEFFDLQTVAPGTTTWSETVQSVIDGFQPGELQYKVLAVGFSGSPGEPGISISNIVSVKVETHLKVPSAFTPGSNDMNFEFKPIIDFAPKDYVMMILDRSGGKLFETTNPGEGWDGTFKGGRFVNEGVYVFFIQYTDYTGIFKSFTGNVTVLYP